MNALWFIRTDEGAFLWDDFKEKGCIVIGWDEDGFEKFESYDDVKKKYGNRGTSSIWNFYKVINVGDIVVAIGNRMVLGVGIITSEYIPPHHSDNPRLTYKNARKVKWLITGDIRPEWELSTLAVTPKTPFGEMIWDWLKTEYIQINPYNEDIFNEIEISAPLSSVHEYNLLSSKKQIIFSGPPGTGKTYKAMECAVNYIKNKSRGE